jgi:hypothetical protein
MMTIIETQATTELVAAYRATIAEKHQAVIRAAQNLIEDIFVAHEATRQCGISIAAAHGDLRKQEFAQATSILDNPRIKSYLKFAQHNPEPETNLERAMQSMREAMQASGAIEFHRHGRQELHTPNFFSTAARQLMSFLSGFRRFIRVTPIAKWDRDTAEMFLYSLKPILEIYADVRRHVSEK